MTRNRPTVVIAILLIVAAGCRPAEPAPSATAGPTPVSTATPGTPARTAVPAATPVPTSTPTPEAGVVLLVFGEQFIGDIYTVVRPALEEAGYRVVVASRTSGPLQAKGANMPVDVDLLLPDVRVEDYDAVLFNCDNDITFGTARADSDRIAQEAAAQGKVLAAICSGPRVLAYAQVVEGKETTGEPSRTCQMLKDAGAICTGAAIERDGLMITARDRYAAAAYVQVVIEALREPRPAPPAATPVTSFSMAKSPQEFDVAGTFQAGLGDLDGDGDLDAVLANPQKNYSQVWLNDGGGRFSNTGQRLTQYGHGIGVADFDGDGDLDAFIACHYFSNASKVYLNDGRGTLRDNGQDLGDARISGAELNLLDLNGDGDVDVHVMYYDPKGLPDKVYLNDGSGTFIDSGLVLDEQTITWGDLDGDGDVDYFGKRWGQGYVAQINDSQGRFAAGWRMDDSQAANGAVALADFDADGDLDALVTNGFRSEGSHPTRLLWNDGTGHFTDSGQLLNDTLSAELAVGDLDADGDLDVFVSNFDLPNEVWLNDGTGRLLDSGLRLGTSTDASTKPSLGDLDGDGDLDVFVGSLTGKPEIWLNTTPAVPAPGD